MILWRRLDMPGHEMAAITLHRNRWNLAGVALFMHGEHPCRLEYEIECDATWGTRDVTVRDAAAEARCRRPRSGARRVAAIPGVQPRGGRAAIHAAVGINVSLRERTRAVQGRAHRQRRRVRRRLSGRVARGRRERYRGRVS
ncbi:MAG: putative glycolipid-binding domain-containing protein [Gemmatimonadaceae bacterium]|nr:putative glycolipid-binding domain-containing protein [Gemmatimonadaceae bacterium]